MTAKEIICLIDALSPKERVEVFEHVHELEDAEIPESFRKAMKEADDGKLYDLDKILSKPHPPNL